ncbi:hypothetical protein [Fluviicola sp.]|uniref:hypothetical protein n=1 Tax=Fluviicola sp. TaxID=1917219 RepID=UPI0031D359E0
MESNRIKQFLPVEKYRIVTKLSPEEVKEHIAHLLFSEYNGKLVGNTFKINRNINYQNSFLPEIKGTITTCLGKTEVDLSMTLTLFVRIFMIVYFSLLAIPSAVILLVLFRRLLHFYFEGLSPFLVIPIGMFLVAYLLMILAFKGEARGSKKRLNTLLKAETISSQS